MFKLNRKHLIILGLILVLIFAFSTVASFGASTKSASAKINSSGGAYLRAKASTSSSKVKLLSNNTSITIEKEVFVSKTSTAAKNKWYYVKSGNNKGYIRSDLVDSVSYTAVSAKITSSSNYRVGPGTKMTKKGSLNKGSSVLVYLVANPVSSTKGSSLTWYKIKVGSNYRYVCSSNISIVGSILENPDADNNESNSDNVTDTKSGATDITASTGADDSNNFTKMSDSQFTAYLTNQGFPESYRNKLLSLHKKHPNWVFVAKKTGINWSDAVTKLNKSGVSLIYSSKPSTSPYLDTGSSSVKSSNRYLYKTYGSTASSNRTGTTVSSGTDFTILDEVWVDASGSSTRWNHIKTSGGKEGYIKGSLCNFVPSNSVQGVVNTDSLNVRSGASTNSSIKKTVKYGEKVNIVLCCKNSSGKEWYRIKYDENYGYVSSAYIDLEAGAELSGFESNSADLSKDESELASIYPKTTITSVIDYRINPQSNAEVVGSFEQGQEIYLLSYIKDEDGTIWYKSIVDDSFVYFVDDELNYEGELIEETINTEEIASLAQTNALEKLTAKGRFFEGSFIAKDGSTWYNANTQTISYYLDPRNFINEDRIYMFEDLSYQKDYQTIEVVNKIISGTKLASNGFTAKMFVDAGEKYNVSPVFLAARARQETGGGSIAISGYTISGKVVYNPFNIGAYSGSNPVVTGLKYAYNQGWTTKEKAVQGGAKFLANGYINAGQNSIYYQKWNVANGSSKVATHQYMTNIQAPYSESYTTMKSYSTYGITNESLTFIIPVFNNMPSSTSLPTVASSNNCY